MTEHKAGQTEATLRAAGEIIEKVRDPFTLAALAILGIVGVTLGALYMGTDQKLGYILIAIGVCVFAILAIVWLTKPRAQDAPAVESVVAPAEPDWTQGQQDHGFFIKEAGLEVRYLDWGETAHREIYEKCLEVMPIRNGELRIDALSGSSAPKNMEFHHTHRIEKLPEDRYHTRSRVTIPGATKDIPIQLIEKSTRHDIPNETAATHTEVTAHPRLETLGVVEKDMQFVVVHILYPTERFSFRADLPDEHRAQPGTIVVHQFTDTNVWKLAEIQPLGDSGNLQVIRWEQREIKARSDFVISWKWQNP